MTAVAVSNASTPAPRRMSWHCFHCGANFSTTTRRALKVTCPKCHTSQDGPERIKQKLAELEELRKAGRAKHTPTKAEPTPATPVAERPRARIVTKSPSPPASAPQPAPAAAEPPAPEPPAPPTPTPETKRRNLFDRVMGYER